MPIELRQVSEEEFNQTLVKTYETDSATAMLMPRIWVSRESV